MSMSADTCERCRGVVCTALKFDSGHVGRKIKPHEDDGNSNIVSAIGIDNCRVNQAIKESSDPAVIALLAANFFNASGLPLSAEAQSKS